MSTQDWFPWFQETLLLTVKSLQLTGRRSEPVSWRDETIATLVFSQSRPVNFELVPGRTHVHCWVPTAGSPLECTLTCTPACACSRAVWSLRWDTVVTTTPSQATDQTASRHPTTRAGGGPPAPHHGPGGALRWTATFRSIKRGMYGSGLGLWWLVEPGAPEDCGQVNFGLLMRV